MKTRFKYLPFWLIAATYCACNTNTNKASNTWRTKKKALQNQTQNHLYAVEKEQGWQLLFNGKNLEGWHLYNSKDSTNHGAWEVKDGLLYCNAKAENKTFGDLVTNRSYENYELRFEWQMALRGNGGVFINVQEAPAFAATYTTAPEYQLLEPAHMDNQTPKKRAGSLWGVTQQIQPVKPKPVGQWNHSKIIQENGKIRFYLNGVLTAVADLKSASWRQKLAQSNFKNNPNYAQAQQGKIALQNWYFESWFRNIKIKPL